MHWGYIICGTNFKYASTTWRLNGRLERRLRAVDMKYLKNVCVVPPRNGEVCERCDIGVTVKENTRRGNMAVFRRI